MPRGAKRFGSRSSSSRHCFTTPDLVGLVVDREVRLEAEPRRLAAEDPPARGVEGHHPHRPRDRRRRASSRRRFISPAALFVNVIARISFGFTPGRADQVDDPVREHARLPGARAGDDEHGPLGREDGLPLGGIQVCEVLLGGRDGHAPDARRSAFEAPCPIRPDCRYSGCLRRREPPPRTSGSDSL